MNVEFLSYDEWLAEVDSEEESATRFKFRSIHKKWRDMRVKASNTVRVGQIYSSRTNGWFNTDTVLDRITKLKEYIEEHRPLSVGIFDWDDYLRFEVTVPDDRSPELIENERQHFLKMEYSEYLKGVFNEAGLKASNKFFEGLIKNENK